MIGCEGSNPAFVDTETGAMVAADSALRFSGSRNCTARSSAVDATSAISPSHSGLTGDARRRFFLANSGAAQHAGLRKTDRDRLDQDDRIHRAADHADDERQQVIGNAHVADPEKI